MACNGLAQSYIMPQTAPASRAAVAVANRDATWQDGISWSLQWQGQKKIPNKQMVPTEMGAIWKQQRAL